MVALFSFENVGLTLGQTRILRGLTGEVPLTGVTCIVGPSGSGKTSLLRLLNRLEVPTEGTVFYKGQDVASIQATELRRNVGMVFQRPALFDGSVLDNLRVASPTLSLSAANAWLTKVGLSPELAEREASLLSGGEAQRLCLVRTLLVGPEALLLDEPTASLDAESVDVIEVYLAELAEAGLPQVWISHDSDQVDRVADTVIQIEELQA